MSTYLQYLQYLQFSRNNNSNNNNSSVTNDTCSKEYKLLLLSSLTGRLQTYLGKGKYCICLDYVFRCLK